MSSDDMAPEAGSETTLPPSQEARGETSGRRKYASVLVIGSLICIAASVYYIVQRSKEERDENGMTKREREIRDREDARKKEAKILASFKAPNQREEFLYDGLENLQMTAAKDAKISDNTRVIGIVEGDKARAYMLGALSYKNSHIVHDSLGKTPLTITYCDKTDNARVFCRTVAPGKFRMVGIEGQDMQLVIDGKHYAQTAKDIPLEDFTGFKVCKWGEWKAKHPNTTLYAGGRTQ